MLYHFPSRTASRRPPQRSPRKPLGAYVINAGQMKRKTNKNYFCPCGSGKKYKNCCYTKDFGFSTLRQKLMNDELPFFASITSSNSQSSSFKLQNAKVVKNGIEKTVFDDEITLSTNTTNGDKTENSSASLVIPIKPNLESKINISGNATVRNNMEPYKIEIRDNPKKIRIKSGKGLFAIIRIAFQRSAGFYFFDVLFGVEGQEETINTDGNKERPHIAIYPDGNGKFIRLLGHNCELESELTYDPSQKKYLSCQVIFDIN